MVVITILVCSLLIGCLCVSERWIKNSVSGERGENWMKKQFVLILPAQKEMAELPLKLRGELWELVGVLEEKGTLAFPQGRIVDEERRIFEIRAHDDGQQARILYYYWDGNDLIFGLAVFVKKKQKMPKEEINLARKRLVQLKKGNWG